MSTATPSLPAAIFAVLRKELRDAVRDRRALWMVGLFVVLYPLVMWGSLQRLVERETSDERVATVVAVVGAGQVPGLLQRLGEHGIEVEPLDGLDQAGIAGLLGERRYTAVIRVDDRFGERFAAMRPATLELWHDSATVQRARLDRLDAVLRAYGGEIAQARLLAHGVSPSVLRPVPIQRYDTASRASRSGRLIAMIFGVFFVATFYFGMNIAIDASAGERERRSLELLLAQPLAPSALIAGKWLAIATVCVVGLGLELLLGHVLLSLIPLEEIGMAWRLGLPTLLLVWLAALPLCLFAAAFELALALNSKSFKEAQTAVGFALVLPLIPVVLVPMLGLDVQPWMYAIPVLAEQTLLLELARGATVPVSAFLSAAAVSLGGAAIALWHATRRVRSERFVLGI